MPPNVPGTIRAVVLSFLAANRNAANAPRSSESDDYNHCPNSVIRLERPADLSAGIEVVLGLVEVGKSFPHSRLRNRGAVNRFEPSNKVAHGSLT